MTNPNELDLDEMLEPIEPPYKTELHATIGRALDGYGIHFFYQQPRIVQVDQDHERWRPAFTLPGYNGLVVEDAYAAIRGSTQTTPRVRAQIYAQNGIPAVFVGPPGLTDTASAASLYEHIQRAARAPNATGSLRAYRPAGGYR